MKKILSLILFAITLPSFAQTTFNYQTDFKIILGKTKDPKDSLSYDKLLKKFAVNDSSMTNYEVLALMIGFTDKPEYKPYQDLDVERKIYNLNADGKFQQALDTANKFLQTHPLSLKGLFEKSYSFFKLDQLDSATSYLIKGRRILNAMHFSGDGKTSDTPIFALGPADGQDYIVKENLGTIGIMGDSRDKNGNFLDILEVRPTQGKSYQLYFIIQHATAKMFEGKSIEDELNELKKQDEEKSKNK